MQENQIVVSSRVRLARNVSKLPFPARLNDERAFSVVMKGAEDVAKQLFSYNFFQMGSLSDTDKGALVERHLISNDLTNNTKNGAVIISKDESMSIMINEEDHYRIQCILKGYDLNKAYLKALEYETELEKRVDMAYDDTLGFLTACPTNVGTGLRASVMLFLPALTESGNMSSLLSTVSRVGLTIRGIYGEGSNAQGYMYQLSNEISLGITEEDIIKRVQDAVKTIVRMESDMRTRMSKDKASLTDRVWRAYGVLTNAYKMDSEECLRMLGEVKLGANLGLIKVDEDKIDKLMIMILPNNLTKQRGEDMSAEDRDVYRASYIKQILSNK